MGARVADCEGGVSEIDWRAAFPVGCRVRYQRGAEAREDAVLAPLKEWPRALNTDRGIWTKCDAERAGMKRIDAPALAWPELPADDWRQRYAEGARVQCRFGSVSWCSGTVHGLLGASRLQVIDDKSGRTIAWMCHENVRPLVSAQGAITSERVVEAVVPAAPPKPTTWTCPLCRGQHPAAAALAEHYLPCGWAWTQWCPVGYGPLDSTEAAFDAALECLIDDCEHDDVGDCVTALERLRDAAAAEGRADGRVRGRVEMRAAAAEKCLARAAQLERNKPENNLFIDGGIETLRLQAQDIRTLSEEP